MCHCHCHCPLRRFPFQDDLVNWCDLEGTRSARSCANRCLAGHVVSRSRPMYALLRTTTWCDSWPPSPQESHLLNPIVQHLWSPDELPEGPSFAITAFLKERVCRLRSLEISNEERGVCSVQLMTAEMSFGKFSALAPQSGAGCRLG